MILKNKKIISKIPANEPWLFKAENADILKAIKIGLSQDATIKRGPFRKYLKKS